SNSAQSAFPETFAFPEIFALKGLASERRNLRRIAKAEVLRDVNALETAKGAHADVIELGEKKSIDEVASIDLELWIIDGFLRDLQTRRAPAQESATAPPIQLHFGFPGPRHQIGQIKPEKIVPFDYVRIALLNNCCELFERVTFGLLSILGIDYDELLPSAVIRQGDAGDWVLRGISQIAFASW